jgi:cytochrome c
MRTLPSRPTPALALAVSAVILTAPGTATAGLWPFQSDPATLTDARLYRDRCGGCHALDHNKYGAAHRNLLGRTAGTQPGYRYSAALARSGIVWTDATLDTWLTDPRMMVPGTRMDVKFGDAVERRRIIGFLKGDASRVAGATATSGAATR